MWCVICAIKGLILFLLSLPSKITILSQPQLNHNSTQAKIIKVWFDVKMTLHHPPTNQKLNLVKGDISDSELNVGVGRFDHPSEINKGVP